MNATKHWPTTSRDTDEDTGWVVNVWTSGPAKGPPGHVCVTRPGMDQVGGGAVIEVRP